MASFVPLKTHDGEGDDSRPMPKHVFPGRVARVCFSTTSEFFGHGGSPAQYPARPSREAPPDREP